MSTAETTPHNQAEQRAYPDSAEYYRDLKNSIVTALEEGEARGEVRGEARGRQEEKLAVARAALAEGLPLPVIAKLTGLSEPEIAALQETTP